MKKGFIVIATTLAATSVLALSVIAPSERILMPITLSSNDSIHQLAIPAPLMAYSNRADLNDLKIRNAEGEAIPMAWIPHTPQMSQNQQTFKAHALQAEEINTNNYSQVVLTLNQAANHAPSVNVVATQSTPEPRKTILGALFDTRSLPEGSYSSSLALDIQTHDGVIVPLTIDSSDDLKNWQTLAETAIVQFKDNPHSHTDIRFEPSPLHGRYLRIRWPEQNAIVLNQASIVSQKSKMPTTQRLALQPDHDNAQKYNGVRLSLPAVAGQEFSLTLHTNTPNSNIPLQLIQQNPNGTQRAIGQTVLFNLIQNGQTITNGPINVQLSGDSVNLLLKPQSQALPKDLTAHIDVPSRRLAFIASGSAPYVLQFKGEGSNVRAIDSLIPNYKTGDADQLPIAHVNLNDLAQSLDISTAALSEANATTPAQPPSTRHWLWAVLIGGVVLLAGMIAVIMRQMKSKT